MVSGWEDRQTDPAGQEDIFPIAMGGFRRWNRTSPSLAWMEHVIGELLRKLDSRWQVLCLRIQQQRQGGDLGNSRQASACGLLASLFQ